ncbi:MAG: HD family phosphohydrolase [Fibrobacterota bacterium]
MSKVQKKKSLKDTTSQVVLGVKKRVQIRLPRFLSPLLLITILTITSVLLFFPYSDTVQSFDIPNIGEVSKETIISPFTFDIMKSKSVLERERKEAMDQVLLVVDYDRDVISRVRKKFRFLRSNILALQDDSLSDSLSNSKMQALKRELSEGTIEILVERPHLLDEAIYQAESVLEKGILTVLLIPNAVQLSEMRKQYNAYFDRHLFYDKQYVTLRRDSMESAVRVADLPVKERALEEISESLRKEKKMDQKSLSSLYEVIDAYVTPNVSFNGMETAARRQKASHAVLPIKGKVIKDSEIVRKHQEVNSEIQEKLHSLHIALQKRKFGGENQRIFAANIGKVLLVIIPLLFMGYYVRVFHQDIMRRDKHLFALGFILIFQVAIIRIGMLVVPRLFEQTGNEISSIMPEFIIPTAVASILVTILFDIKLSFVVTLFVSIYFGVAEGFNHVLFIYSLLGGLTAGVATLNIRYRWDFFRAMPPVALLYSVIIILWHIVGFRLQFLEVLQNLGMGILNCIITTFLAMMSVTIFENLFDITTDMTLVELSDMNHPLLKRLSIEAAGTYNHSVLVANLAESAAERIHAHPLLARVASYYHDIGKIVKPNYFVENQKIDRNIHNKLTPNMSALIISSHVKEGLEFAKKHKLPSVIRDCITQHHGNSTVSFFYEKALEQDPHKQVQEKDFRYPGPRPQTKENAIIMLADSVEAASRSLATSSPKLLRELVKKIIHDKFASSQLDECDLTFQDLDKIIEGFMPVLQGIFHTRIEYPNKK